MKKGHIEAAKFITDELQALEKKVADKGYSLDIFVSLLVSQACAMAKDINMLPERFSALVEFAWFVATRAKAFGEMLEQDAQTFAQGEKEDTQEEKDKLH